MPKIVDHDRFRVTIVEAARVLIAEEGSEALTLRRLAASCGMANGALRTYFPSKHALLLAVAEDATGRVRRLADQHAEGHGLAGLRPYYLAWLALDGAHQQDARVIVGLEREVAAAPDFAALFDEREKVLDAFNLARLGEAVDAGEIEGRHPLETTSLLLSAFLYGALTAHVVRGTDPTSNGLAGLVSALDAILAAA